MLSFPVTEGSLYYFSELYMYKCAVNKTAMAGTSASGRRKCYKATLPHQQSQVAVNNTFGQIRSGQVNNNLDIEGGSPKAPSAKYYLMQVK